METVVVPAAISEIWIGGVAILAAFSLGIAVIMHRCRQRARMLHALIESFEKPLLFYNEYGRLAFHSSGLVLFDKKSSLKAIKHPPAQPTKNQPKAGEIIIDHNRYRFFCRQFEYSPGKTGILVMLEYLGGEPARG